MAGPCKHGRHRPQPTHEHVLSAAPALSVRPQRARGDASLAVRAAGGRTRLADLRQSGCAKLRLPRTFADHVEAVAINTSGGLTGDDELTWAAQAGNGAALSLSTQACERVYRSAGGCARVRTVLSAGEDARLAWLPQETILFDGAALDRELQVDLHPTARVLLLEPFVFGRTAMGETVRRLHLRERWTVHRDGRLEHAEALDLDGDAQAALDSPHVGNGARAMATLVLLAPGAETMAHAARRLAPEAGIGAFPDRLAVRLVAGNARDLRTTLLPLIDLLSPVGEPGARLPRVWRL